LVLIGDFKILCTKETGIFATIKNIIRQSNVNIKGGVPDSLMNITAWIISNLIFILRI